jgi:hypothetical protein
VAKLSEFHSEFALKSASGSYRFRGVQEKHAYGGSMANFDEVFKTTIERGQEKGRIEHDSPGGLSSGSRNV